MWCGITVLTGEGPLWHQHFPELARIQRLWDMWVHQGPHVPHSSLQSDVGQDPVSPVCSAQC